MRASAEIDALIASLVDAGVAPKYVSRLAAELHDHLADLEDEALRFGVPGDEVADDADQRLGASAVIAREFTRRPELVSRVHTSRWAKPALRGAARVYGALGAPARLVACNRAAVFRYAAATAAATAVTAVLFLGLTTAVTPHGPLAQVEAGHDGQLAAAEPAGASLRPEDRPMNASEQAVATSSVQPPPPAAEHSRVPEPAPTTFAVVIEELPPPFPAAGAQFVGDARTTLETFVAEPAFAPPTYGRPDLDTIHPPPVRLAWSDQLSATPPRNAEIDIEIRFAFDFQPPDTAFRSLVQPQPEYPLNAVRRGLEGYVVVEYTVLQNGSVEQAFVVESSSSIFHRAALEAANSLRYPPRVIRGQPINVAGVRTLIRFQLGGVQS